MAIVRCEKGHYYDDTKFSSCPHCGVRLSAFPSEEGPTVSLKRGEGLTWPLREQTYQEEKTRGVFSSRFNGEPVVGWLVCVKGAERGRDYRIHPSRNFIGRSAQMDICIFDDPRISRERHAALVYDPVSRKFLLQPGQGPVSVNDVLLTDTRELKEGDRLELGDAVYLFIPFCKEGREWDD